MSSSGRAPLRIGTRASALALAQAKQFASLLNHPVEIVKVTTSGDLDSKRSPNQRPSEDKARWVRELDRALLAGEIDLAVHSAKDVPGQLPERLKLLGVCCREDPRDALIGAASIDRLAVGATVGTTSLRREAQLRAVRPDLKLVPLRGNVDTRLGRVSSGEFDATVLAVAGLKRLGFEQRIGCILPLEGFIPAPGQGSIVIQAERDFDLEGLSLPLDPVASGCLLAERSAAAALGASCHSAVGILATVSTEDMLLQAFVGLADGSQQIVDRISGPKDQPELLGQQLAERLLSCGAAALIRNQAENYPNL